MDRWSAGCGGETSVRDSPAAGVAAPPSRSQPRRRVRPTPFVSNFDGNLKIKESFICLRLEVHNLSCSNLEMNFNIKIRALIQVPLNNHK